MEKQIDQLTSQAVELLRHLIAIPSVSRDETRAADEIESFLSNAGLRPQRHNNNVWAMSLHWDDTMPTVLLNAHIDTVKPVATWTRNPYYPDVEDDCLYGLGSNDCGGGLVSLLMTFVTLGNVSCEGTNYNLLFLASAEEEVSGKDGISSVLPLLPKVDVAIVGEPTGMQPAIAEKGLMVIDGVAHGKSGHAARNEGVNAIYEALDDLVWLRDYRFDKVSPLLGPTKMTVTVIEAGTQHNVVPDTLHFILDVRTNENHRNEDVYEFLCKNMKHCELKARSFRLHSSAISLNHPLIKRCVAMGLKPFGSPTLSDQALMSFPSFKLGPGESSRSHSADEYICRSEIAAAIEKYLEILEVRGKR
jgi:acetylornithine deacetylase